MKLNQLFLLPLDEENRFLSLDFGRFITITTQNKRQKIFRIIVLFLVIANNLCDTPTPN